MVPRILVPGAIPPGQSGTHAKHLLALTGGGYRGLFSARVLERMEEGYAKPLATRFDMIAGTSVGGILAIGIACGVSATRIVATMQRRGPQIFSPRRHWLRALIRTRYSSQGLRQTILEILGEELAFRPFTEIPSALLVTAVEERSGQPVIFRTRRGGGDGKDEISTLDVALATSAAPTYFPAHVVGSRVFVDGGLVANAPDLVLIAEALRLFTVSLDALFVCSVGTAALPRAGNVSGLPGQLGWLAKYALVDLIMDAQANLAAEQVRGLRPGSYLRIDRSPHRRLDLDDASPATSRTLLELADLAVAEVQRKDLQLWRRMLANQIE